MELLKCSYCESSNCYIQYNGWLVCRNCALASSFDWQAAPTGMKMAIFDLMKDRAELGTTDQQIADKINQEKVDSYMWFADETNLAPLSSGQEYARYYNLYIRLKHGTTEVSAASESGNKPAPARRKKKAANRDANGGG
jgi:ssDNA-binding replication factor A large subunit